MKIIRLYLILVVVLSFLLGISLGKIRQMHNQIHDLKEEHREWHHLPHGFHLDIPDIRIEWRTAERELVRDQKRLAHERERLAREQAKIARQVLIEIKAPIRDEIRLLERGIREE